MNKKNILEFFLLTSILVGAFWVRLYKIDNPLADWHSWRQADTSSVSRNFLKFGFDVLHPRFDDLSNVPSGKENPLGYRFVEFPFYNLLQAGSFWLFPQKTLEWWGRMVSIIFSLASIVLLYLLAKKYFGRRIAFLSAFFFAFLPYNVYYSRVVLPEPMMIFTSLSMIYFFVKWLEGGRLSFIFYLLSIILTAISFLLKPFTVFLCLPLLYLVWQKWQFSSLKKISLYFYAILSVLPFILWRLWMSQFPEGIPANLWLFNDANIRFKGAFFYWLFAERLANLILGYWGVVFLVLGLILRPQKREGWFFHFWFGSILLYFAIIAGGNVRHDYYQAMVVPIISLFLAKGAGFLLFDPKINFSKTLSYLLSFICLLFMLAFSWYQVRGFFNVNHPEIVETGKVVDRLTPKNAKIIAPYNGDTAFLYQTNRQGWPLLAGSLDYLISKGANFYVTTSFDRQTEEIAKIYPVLVKTEKYIIISLQGKK